MKNLNSMIIILLLVVSGITFYQSERISILMRENEDLEIDYTLSLEALERLEDDYKYVLPSIGGVETTPSDFSKNFGIVFPIAEEDFKQYTSPYGLRTSPFLGIEMHHSGVDISTVWQAQVVSIADGIIVEHYPPPGTPFPGGGYFMGHPVYGGMVRIDHGEFETLYAHLAYTSIRTGQQVSAGQVIGRVGNTGLSIGRHLHLEMKISDKLVNPLLYIGSLENF